MAERNFLHQIDLFTNGDDGYHTYRIPALATTTKGTVLAFCEGRKHGRGDAGKIDLLLRRTARRHHRPLLEGGDRRQVMAELIEQRYPVYAEADLTVKTTHEAPAATVARVGQAIESYLAGCRPPGAAP